MTMILSSADILRILGGSEIIRLSAKLKIVDGQPPLSGAEGLFIFIDRFPFTDEFQATWTIYIESDGSEPDDLVIAEIKKLLPGVKIKPGLMTTVTTTDFLSDSTQKASEAPNPIQAKVDLTQYERRFQELVEGVQDQMLLVSSGRPGRDGANGKDGTDGLDGKDLKATETELEDLANVEEVVRKEDGQVLTWKDGKWQNLFVPQVSKIGGGGSGGPIALNDLTDVDAVAPNNNDVLVYNSVSGNWEVSAAPPADISGNSIDDLLDVDTSTTIPVANQALVWNGSKWVPGNVAADAPVDSVNGQTGVVVLTAADVGAATSAQGILADTAIQPGDNISDLANDAGYITDAGVTQIVAGTNVTIDPVNGSGAVTINATGGGTGDADGGDFGALPGPDAGDFDAGTSTSTLAYPVDGGNFATGTTEAFGDTSFDGGEVT